MSALLFFISLFIVGHFSAASLVYLNHRFVFHGNLRRWSGLKYLARLHALHHAHVNEDVAEYIFMPWWGQIIVISAIVALAYFVSISFALGIISFSFLYMHRHLAIHTKDQESHFHYHHIFHHNNDVKVNFSGMYPFLDRVFGTYVESRPNIGTVVIKNKKIKFK